MVSKAEELICRAVDGQLADTDRVGLEQHVHECSPCAVLRDDLARNDSELRAAFEARRIDEFRRHVLSLPELVAASAAALAV